MRQWEASSYARPVGSGFERVAVVFKPSKEPFPGTRLQLTTDHTPAPPEFYDNLPHVKVLVESMRRIREKEGREASLLHFRQATSRWASYGFESWQHVPESDNGFIAELFALRSSLE